MISARALVAAALVASLSAVPLVVRAYSSSGQLVYSFTYSSNQDVTARDSSTSAEDVNSESGLSGGSTNGGMSNYHGSLNEKGTMTVSVTGKQADDGLIVDISEQGENIHRAPPATCVVYGSTRVICDPNKTVYPEEYTLLRFLGPNFVDPNSLDAKRHWQTAQSGGGEVIKGDYTIDANTGGVMQIGEVRSIRPAGGGNETTDVQTKITYDFNRSVPTAVDEYVTQRQDNGVTGTTKTVYQTTLNLVSDSVPKS